MLSVPLLGVDDKLVTATDQSVLDISCLEREHRGQTCGFKGMIFLRECDVCAYGAKVFCDGERGRVADAVGEANGGRGEIQRWGHLHGAVQELADRAKRRAQEDTHVLYIRLDRGLLDTRDRTT